MRCDVVYPLGLGSHWDNNELRYSLRSLEKNFMNINRVFIVGVKPEWIKSVIHIETEDIYKKNKDANLIRKVLLVCERGDLSKDFLRISDDQLILKPIYSYDVPILYSRKLEEVIEIWNKEGVKVNRWGNRLRNTYNKLKEEGKSTWEYDTHSPVIHNRLKFIQIMKRYDYTIEGGGYNINTLYFNNLNLKNWQHNKWDEYKVGFDSPMDLKSIIKSIKDKWFMGYDDRAISSGDIKGALEILFSKKSKYEK